ncbi:MAG: FGGY family carbohydrate kinase [Eubacteriales bacterium]|nr:FGGY family carbohydrate kinase [Eubacteriales bacterium]
MLLGIDVGTTGTKSILIREDGHLVHSSYQGYNLISPRPSYVEQSPEDWWRAIVLTVRDCASHLPASEEISAMCLSVQSGTLVPVDKNFHPVVNAISWLDTRGKEEQKILLNQYGEEYFYLKTGWKLSDCYNFIQICHIRRSDPELFDRIAYFLSAADYLTCRLTGQCVIDENNAENSQLCNVTTGQWDEEILHLAGIDKSKVASMIKSGQIIGNLTPQAARELGLNSNIKVISGAQDQYCSAVGVGAAASGDIMFSTGTSWVLLGLSDKLIYDTNTYLTIGRHILPNVYSSFAYTPAGGAAMKWYRDHMGLSSEDTGPESYDQITQRAEAVEPGANGLFFFPHLGGTLFPTWSSESRGVLWGMDFMHTRAHICRAVMEGISFDLLWMIHSMQKAGYEFQTMRCLGGSTRSRVWMQMVSDMTGLEMSVSSYADMAPLGAAMIAGVGSGIYQNYAQAREALGVAQNYFFPDSQKNKRYQELFKQYCELFQKLRGTFDAP